MGAQWLSDRVLDLRPRGRRLETHRRHCVVSLNKNINPSLVLVQPRKTCPYLSERLLMGGKKSNKQTGTWINSEDPDEMPQNEAFHLCLHCFLRQNNLRDFYL